jgi:hypothetical protein
MPPPAATTVGAATVGITEGAAIGIAVMAGIMGMLIAGIIIG